jgi:hypothetical protein
MPDHSTLTDPFLHEPKGVADAAVGLVYVSDGAGSGAWEIPPYPLNASIPDISTADTVYIPIPKTGVVSKVVAVIKNAITVADVTLTVKNAAGASMGTLLVPFTGSAAGTSVSLSPVSNNAVTAGSFMTIETNGNSTTVAIVSLSVLVEAA